MGEYVSFASDIIEDGSQAGAQAIQEEVTKNIIIAKSNIAKLLQDLNNQYKNIATQDLPIKDIENRQEQIREYVRQIKDNIEEAKKLTWHSVKGGADIAPKGFFKKINSISDKAEKMHTALSAIRKNTYGTTRDIKNKDFYKETALKAMSTVYRLRQAITGAEERIIIAYEGDSGQIWTTEAPIIDFLTNKDIINNLSITMQSTASFTGSDPFQLSFKSSVISQLKNMTNEGLATTNKEFKYETAQGNIIQTKEDFLNYLSKLDDPVITYRTDSKKGYKVIKTGAAGYILENMLANQYGGNIDLSKRGNDTWYTGGDFSANGIEYSAKSMLMGKPTLTKMSSIQTVLQELYNALDAPTTMEIQNKIKNLFRAGAYGSENLANQDINNILKILTG